MNITARVGLGLGRELRVMDWVKVRVRVAVGVTTLVETHQARKVRRATASR